MSYYIKNKLILAYIILAFLMVIFYAQIILAKVKSTNSQENPDLAIGLLETAIRTNFYNDGNFVSLPGSGLYSGLVYKNISYLEYLVLWVGIPEGPWTPIVWNEDKRDSVSLGPTVSGSLFNFWWISGTDWGPIPGSRHHHFSGDLLLSDIKVVASTYDLPILADSRYPLTWPENIYGERVWPGTWAIEPETNRRLTGQFRADQEILFHFTDIGYSDKDYPPFSQNYNFLSGPLQGYPIGVEVSGSILAYDEKYCNNFCFVDLTLRNKSRWNYENVYLGIHYSPSLALIGEQKYEELYRKKFKHILNYLTTEYEPVLGMRYPYNLSYYFLNVLDPLPDSVKIYYLGIKLLETPKTFEADGIDNDADGKIDESEGEQLGLTGWHFFNDKPEIKKKHIQGIIVNELVDTPLRRGELIQYKVLSGDTTDLLPIENSRFFYPRSGDVNPNFDSLETDVLDSIAYSDAIMLMSSGPFNWASGDTVKFAFAVVFGEDLEDLKANCRVAQKIYDNDYRRMEPPTAPTVSAVAGDGQVTLYWDDAAEKSADFLTGYADFEGYRIYRTEIDPLFNRWGEEIRDGSGKLVGFVPVAQFDLADGIGGFDPQYPHLYLGSDTGIRHSWTDTTVKNGVTYWYAVCAYDQGIRSDSLLNPAGWPAFRSLENSKGTDASLWRNLVRVTPGTYPSNYQAANFYLSPLPGTLGNGKIHVEIMDPSRVTGHNYTIIFDDTSSSSLVYDVLDENEGTVVLNQMGNVHGEEGPVFDGLRFFVEAFDQVEVYGDSTGWFKMDSGDSSQCNYKIEAISSLAEPLPFNYEIRFTEQGDTSYILHKTAPFEIWNTSQGKELEWEIFTNSPTDTTDSLKSVWSSGDFIRIREEVGGSYKFSWEFTLTRNPEVRYVERDTVLDGYPAVVIDTLVIDIAPVVGDVARIVTTKPFHSGDRFSLQTYEEKSSEVSGSELSKIKVVPNPYLVTAAWAQHSEDHRLMFTHLPAHCEILIFTPSGDLVAHLEHDDVHSGSEFWNLQSYEGMEVVSGLYLYVVKTSDGKKKKGKFVVVR